MKKYAKILTKEFLIKEYSKKEKLIIQIAQKIGCSDDTIYNYLRRCNIPRNIPETLKQHYCKEFGCNNEISYSCWKYGKGRCRKCFSKGNKNGNYKGKVKIKCLQCNKIFELLPYQAKIRKFCSYKCMGKYYSGTKNPNFGNKWNEAQKKRQGKLTKKEMKKVDMKKILSHINRFGKKNGRYIDGRNPLTLSIRHLKEYKDWRNKIFIRDNYNCQECRQVGGKLEAHHKKSFAGLLSEFLKEYDQFSPIEDKETLIRLAMKWQPFWDIDNGITLCKKCHDITKKEAFKYE